MVVDLLTRTLAELLHTVPTSPLDYMYLIAQGKYLIAQGKRDLENFPVILQLGFWFERTIDDEDIPSLRMGDLHSCALTPSCVGVLGRGLGRGWRRLG